jgi:hypothetical protein
MLGAGVVIELPLHQQLETVHFQIFMLNEAACATKDEQATEPSEIYLNRLQFDVCVRHIAMNTREACTQAGTIVNDDAMC